MEHSLVPEDGQTNSDMSAVPAKPARPAQARIGPRELARMKQQEKFNELSTLESGALYITLDYRSTKDNDFHWALYHHIDANVGGWKFHVVGSEGHWYPDNGLGKTTTDILASPALVGLMRLANIGVGRDVSEAVQRIVMAENERVNEIAGLTCRIYVARACERLKAERFLDFPDWPRLQTEIFAFGNNAKADFSDGQGPKPRPVQASELAK